MATYNANTTTAELGNSNQAVADLQTQLNAKGANLKVDSMYGPLTQAAATKYGVTVPDTITSSKLSPTKQLNLPDAKPATYGGLDGSIESLVNQQNQQLQQDATPAQNAYLQALRESGTISSSVDRTEQDKAKKQSDLYTSQIEQEQLANRRQIERLQKNMQGALASGINIESERLNRESLSKQADLAILQTAANRNYDTARSIADRQVEMKMEQSRANLEALKMLDQREYGEITKKKEREYDKQLAVENQIKQLKLNVAQYGGGSALLSQLSSIDTTKPGAFDQALKVAGRYASDPLDRAIKQAQLNKLNAELGDGNGVAGRQLSSTEFSTFTANPLYKEATDGTAYKAALERFKQATKDYGTREVLSAKGSGELAGAYQALVASTKDYFKLGTLDNGVEKLVSLGVPAPDSFTRRDKKVISSIDTLVSSADSSITKALSQLEGSVYGNSAEFQLLKQQTNGGQDTQQQRVLKYDDNGNIVLDGVEKDNKTFFNP